MISPRQRQERQHLMILGLVCLATLIIGIAWAMWGDASQVTPVATATEILLTATPGTPVP